MKKDYKINKSELGTKSGFDFPLSDESTPITTGVKYTTRLVYSLELEQIRCICTVTPTTTSINVDMFKNGVSILTTKCIIPIGATISNLGVLNNTTILDTDIISFTVLQGDVAGAGLKIQGKGWELNN